MRRPDWAQVRRTVTADCPCCGQSLTPEGARLVLVEAAARWSEVYSGEGRAWVRPEAEFRERFAELCSPFVGDKAEHRDQSDPRIHHIRHYREVNGSGLKEALDAVNGGYRAPEGWVPNPRRSHLPRQPNDT